MRQQFLTTILAMGFSACGTAKLPGTANSPEAINAKPAIHEDVQSEWMKRWNSAAQGAVVTEPESGAKWDFMWNSFVQFPHPTFKGGNEIAYQAFAHVLVLFLNDANIQYLRDNDLLKYDLQYQFLNGRASDLGPLTDLASPDAFRAGWISDQDRDALAQICPKIGCARAQRSAK